MRRSNRPCGSSRRWMRASRSSAGNSVASDHQDPVLDDGLHLSGSTPGSATKIKTSSSVSRTSIGGSHVGPRGSAVAVQAEELPVHPLGTGELFYRLGQHPVHGVSSRHPISPSEPPASIGPAAAAGL